MDTKINNGGERQPVNKKKQYAEKTATQLSSELKYKLQSNQITVKSPEKKMTTEEKIASVHIDFDRDNILPELNDEDLAEVGSMMNKPVLLKKHVIDLNELHHSDLSLEDSKKIIAESLYSNKKEIFPSKHKDKPNYYTFAKIVRQSRKNYKPIYGVKLLDVDGSKENFEIVHWHFVPYDKIDSVKPKK